MLGEDFISKILGGIAIVSGSLILGYWYGDTYGSSAWKLASARAALVSTNKALAQLKAEDDAISTREAAEEKARMEDFAKAEVQKLPVNKSTAEALNKLEGG